MIPFGPLVSRARSFVLALMEARFVLNDRDKFNYLVPFMMKQGAIVFNASILLGFLFACAFTVRLLVPLRYVGARETVMFSCLYIENNNFAVYKWKFF